jgi:Arc/MetJ-type ribon-helix-helix transcriptional regulator
MTVELKPEDEALIRERLQTGDGASVEDVVHRALLAWASSEAQSPQPQQRRKTLSEFLMESPLAGSELDLERDRDSGRTLEL